MQYNLRIYMRLSASLCFLLFAATLLSAQPVTPRQIAQIDSSLKYLHERALFNGTVLLAENDRILYQKSYGVADISTGKPLTTASAFNLASISKQFMATMIALLQEENRLKFDDLVQQYLPEFPYPDITIRHLLNQNSGLPEYFDLAQQHFGPLDTIDNTDILKILQFLKPAVSFSPGERWEYCNTNYVVLGSLIEKISGMPVADFFQKKITKPFGLKNTYIYHLGLKTWPDTRVFGFRRENGKNLLNDLVRVDGIVGDGNVYASAEDLLRWTQVFFGGKVLKKATLAEMLKPGPLKDGSTHLYGFGWGLSEDQKIVQHTGGWVGFLNWLQVDRGRNRTFVILSNGSNSAAHKAVDGILNAKKYTLPVTQLIQNVRLMDGTGAPAQTGALRLADGKIMEVGMLTPFPGELVFDGKGRVLAPGFIDTHSHHDRDMEEHPDMLPALSQGITTVIVGQDGGGQPIDSIEARLQRHAIAANIGTYTGHTALRMAAMGVGGLFRGSKPAELEKMKLNLKSEMEKGTFGLATGLEYERAFFSTRNEVLELAKVCAAGGGRYISHIRSEDISLEEAIDEIIEIGRIAKLPVQISHIKIAMKSKWGTSRAILAQLQQARASGVDITADCYPYDYWLSTLRVLFPKRDYTNPESADFACRELFDPEGSRLAYFSPHPSWAGKSVGEIAREKGVSPAQALTQLVAETEAMEAGNSDAVSEAIMGKSMSEEDLVNFLTWPNTNLCSDGFGGGHPRGYGAFPRFLGRYVREKKIMLWETAIHKTTGLAAEHLGLRDRGLLAPGYWADLVLFNPDTVGDNATIANSTAISTGIDAVWVNGVLVYQDGKTTGQFPGKLVKKQ